MAEGNGVGQQAGGEEQLLWARRQKGGRDFGKRYSEELSWGGWYS